MRSINENQPRKDTVFIKPGTRIKSYYKFILYALKLEKRLSAI